MFKASECKNFKGVDITTVGDSHQIFMCNQSNCVDASHCDQRVEKPIPEPPRILFEPWEITLKAQRIKRPKGME